MSRWLPRIGVTWASVLVVAGALTALTTSLQTLGV
jgi:hypothetical protein